MIRPGLQEGEKRVGAIRDGEGRFEVGFLERQNTQLRVRFVEGRRTSEDLTLQGEQDPVEVTLRTR